MESSHPAAATPANHGGGAWRGLALACAVYLALRALLLVTAFDATALWPFEPYMCGTIARSMLGGGGDLPLPFYYDNAAGPVLMAFLVAPFFAVFGPSYLALKLMACTLGLGTLVLAWLLLRRAFNVRTANIAALLLALAPTTLTKYTLIAAGNHSENLFFTMLALWSFFEMHARGVTPRRLLASGLFGGWAFTIFIGALTPLGLMAIAHLGLRGWRKSVRDVPPAVLGLVVGIAPVVWLNLGSGGRGLDFLIAKFGEEGTRGLPFTQRIGDFFATYLPAASTYPAWLGIPGRAADLAFVAVTIAAFAVGAPLALRALAEFLRRQTNPGDESAPERQRALVFCLWFYLPLTAVAFGLSNLKIGGYVAPIEAGGYRYFLPHFVFVACLTAIACDALARAGSTARRRASIALAAAPLALGTFNFALIDFTFAHPNVGAHYEGHRFSQVARALLLPKVKLTPEQVVAHAESYEPVLRWRVYFGLGFNAALAQALFHPKDPLELAPILARFPAERRADVARGVGTFFRDPPLPSRVPPKGDLRPVDRELVLGWLRAREPFAEQVVEGLQCEWTPVLNLRVQSALDDAVHLLERAPPEFAPAQARGFGVFCGRLLARDIASEREPIVASFGHVPPALRDAAFEGLGAGLADGVESPRIRAAAVAWIPDASIAGVLAGFVRRAHEIAGDGSPIAAPEFDAALPQAWRDGWTKASAH